MADHEHYESNNDTSDEACHEEDGVNFDREDDVNPSIVDDLITPVGDDDNLPSKEVNNSDKKYIPRVPDVDLPFLGQNFNSTEDARAFYNKYAKEAGFSTRVHSNRKNENGPGYRWIQFTCSKQGTTNHRWQETERHKQPRTGVRRRGYTRCECKASFTVRKLKNDDRWIVSGFNAEHNHPLTSPKKVHFLPSHRNVTPAQKNLLSQLSEANIGTGQTFRVMEIDSGGPSSVGCLERDIRNHERNMRNEHLGHDAESLVAFFESEKRADPNYFYSIRTEGNVFNMCFWADSQSRSAYAYFGDVVVFDTTYNTNKYGMIFAPFVGVNHHRQTVLFGCGFLSNETIESFIWLFSQFIAAMPSGVAPRVIITDQDQAIARAIAEVFPPTVHRLCLWHITNKYAEKLGPTLYGDYKDILHDVVHRSETPEEFEKKWGVLMSTTALGGNDWLRSMYGIRDKWVPAYVRDFFAAGMSSSQRVEAHHSFLKTYVIKKNSLVDFILRFKRAVEHQRHQEEMADHIDKNEVPMTSSLFPFEAQMRNIYTKTMFLLFQDELQNSVSYDCTKVSSTADTKVYQLLRYDRGLDHPRHVTWSTASASMTCSCKQFEFSGYLCRHILCLMYRKGVRTVLDRYILRRWTKTAKSVPIFESTPESLARQSSIVARTMMVSEFMVLTNEVSLEPDVISFVSKGMRDIARQAREMMAGRMPPEENTQRIIGPVEDVTIQDPVSVRAKGSGKRLKSSKEKAMNQKKCSRCRQPGHTIRTCPQLQSRTDLVEGDDQQDNSVAGGSEYQPDMSFATGDYGLVSVDVAFVSQGGDSYSVHQSSIPGDDFLG